MPTSYIFIDYENVQPENLDFLRDKKFTVYLFCGLNQNSIPFDIASRMQQLGDRGKYVKASGHGKNALDFHIAYYMGRLSIEDPDACFHIISRDKGYDPLVKHLKSNNIRARRVEEPEQIPNLHTRKLPDQEGHIPLVVKNLIGRGRSRPKKLESLVNTINAILPGNPGKKELMAIIEKLQDRSYLQVENEVISYNLPPEA